MATEVRMALFRPPLPKAFRQVAAVLRRREPPKKGVERRGHHGGEERRAAAFDRAAAASSSTAAAAAPHRPAVAFVCVIPCVCETRSASRLYSTILPSSARLVPRHDSSVGGRRGPRLSQ